MYALLASGFGQKVLKSVGVGSGYAIATYAALYFAISTVAAVLASGGVGGMSELLATLFVEGIPRTWPALLGLLQTIPGALSATIGVLRAVVGLAR